VFTLGIGFEIVLIPSGSKIGEFDAILQTRAISKTSSMLIVIEFMS
jgi:hypothetical protein